MVSPSSVGVVLPTVRDAIEPLTPLSPPPLPLCLGPAFADLLRRGREPPRSHFTSPREKRCFVMTRGVFHREGPFVRSGGLYSPGRATAASLLASTTTAGWHSHATLGLRRSCTVWRRKPTRDSSIRAERSPTYDRRRSLRARPPFTPAATLFGALRVSLFEARRRLPTSATAFTTCGHLPELSIPRREGGLDLHPFLNASRSLPCGSG